MDWLTTKALLHAAEQQLQNFDWRTFHANQLRVQTSNRLMDHSLPPRPSTVASTVHLIEPLHCRANSHRRPGSFEIEWNNTAQTTRQFLFPWLCRKLA